MKNKGRRAGGHSRLAADLDKIPLLRMEQSGSYVPSSGFFEDSPSIFSANRDGQSMRPIPSMS